MGPCRKCTNMMTRKKTPWKRQKSSFIHSRLFFEDALNSLNDEVINDIGGFDFKIELKDNSFKILFGIEPSYMYDSYICYCFDSEKENSYIHKGQAFGYYGADIKIKSNKSYKRCGKEFRECMDKYYENLMRCLSE